MAAKHIRESNFELLRIIAMLMIVFYHMLYQIVYGITNIALYKALWFPLHIGVILFVLISGFFSIRASISGFINLCVKIFVLTVPLEFISIYLYSGDIPKAFSSLFILSNSPFWYVRMYVCLYLISPILNAFLNKASEKERMASLLVLGYISCIYGTISVDHLFVDSDGKNLINFILIYFIGNTLHFYRETFKHISKVILFAAFIGLNIVLVVSYLCLYDSWANPYVFKLGYSYNSPIVILNAVLFFVISLRWNFKSQVINGIAKSVFSVYLIQESPFILWSCIAPLIGRLVSVSFEPVFLLPSLLIFTIVLFSICIIVDRLCNPIWKRAKEFGNKLELKIEKYERH